MERKNILCLGASVFAIVTFVHFLRIVNGWTFQIANWSAPMWLSWLAVLLAGFLSYNLFRLK